jgi:hypothetical protein
MPDRPDRDPDDQDAGRADDEPELDFDAEFSRLIADWGPTPDVEEVRKEARPPAGPSAGPSDDSLRRLLRPAWPDEPAPAQRDDEHFEPPAPPPIARPEPRRLIAWVALVGAPILGLVLLVSPLTLPPYIGYLLFASFVGGFGYLVWTMGAGRGQDGWDDGARL